MTFRPEIGDILISHHGLPKLGTDIEGDNLSYSRMYPSHHGLQCNHIEGDENYSLILEKCAQVVKLCDEINLLNKPSNKP